MRIKSLQPRAAKRETKVLYIAGPTRSGSTIISNILGQIDGFFHAGEVIEAWDRGRTWMCSCGQLPNDCAVWSTIFRKLDADVDSRDRAAIIGVRDKLSRSHKVILRSYLRTANDVDRDEKEIYVRGLSRLYALIESHTDSDVIVDSSKNVGYADSLSGLGSIDLNVVHLIRDSRATVFSWSKKKQELWKSGPVKTAIEWSSRNLALECFKRKHPGRYIQVRYEDFMTHPRETVIRILDQLGISGRTLPFVSPHEVVIESSHGLCGNPGRYNHGAERLVLDDRWKKMKRNDGLVATAVTWPLLLKYRYPLQYA